MCSIFPRLRLGKILYTLVQYLAILTANSRYILYRKCRVEVTLAQMSRHTIPDLYLCETLCIIIIEMRVNI